MHLSRVTSPWKAFANVKCADHGTPLITGSESWHSRFDVSQRFLRHSLGSCAWEGGRWHSCLLRSTLPTAGLHLCIWPSVLLWTEVSFLKMNSKGFSPPGEMESERFIRPMWGCRVWAPSLHHAALHHQLKGCYGSQGEEVQSSNEQFEKKECLQAMVLNLVQSWPPRRHLGVSELFFVVPAGGRTSSGLKPAWC